MTRDEWVATFASDRIASIVRRGDLVLPCRGDYDEGCDYAGCQGWVTVSDREFDEFDRWTPEEIQEARDYLAVLA